MGMKVCIFEERKPKMIEKIDYTGMRETDRRAGEWVVRKEDGWMYETSGREQREKSVGLRKQGEYCYLFKRKAIGE